MVWERKLRRGKPETLAMLAIGALSVLRRRQAKWAYRPNAVREGSSDAEHAPGVNCVGRQGAAVYEVGSGKYHFAALAAANSNTP